MSSFVASFHASTAARNAECGTPFTEQELGALLAIWGEALESDEDIDPEAAIEAVAEAVGDDRCELGCILLEWA